jgi:D-sedoheptulose 7-phosphate isomerase
MDNFTQKHLEETARIAQLISVSQIEKIIEVLVSVRENRGRLFILGVGGSAANAAHAVNDFRKLTEIEAYAPTDNVAELTARTNDEGWQNVFVPWLRTSKLSSMDCVFILSVGGGNKDRQVSVNICEAIDYAISVGAKVAGIVGRDGGYTAKSADTVIVVPTVNAESITPHAESFQEILWHLMVSHPKLKVNPTTW